MRGRVMLSCGAVVALLVLPVRGDEPKTFGTGVSLTEVTPLARVLESPAAFEGKTVRVEGVVKAVCQHMGCWMSLAPSETAAGPTLRLKVDDGVIVFPVSAKGRRAAAQGVVERVKAGDAEGHEAAGEHARTEASAHGSKAPGVSAHAAPGSAAHTLPADALAKPAASAQYHVKVTGAIVY